MEPRGGFHALNFDCEWDEDGMFPPPASAVHAVGRAGSVCVFDMRVWRACHSSSAIAWQLRSCRPTAVFLLATDWLPVVLTTARERCFVWCAADCSAPNLTLKPRVMINIRYTPTSTFGAEKGRLPRDPMPHSLFRTLRPQVQDLYRASLAVTV